MATISLADVAFRNLPHNLFVSSGSSQSNLYVRAKKSSLTRKHSNNERKCLQKSNRIFKSRGALCCSVSESGKASIDIAGNEVNENDLMAAQNALLAIEKERDRLLKELAMSKLKQHNFLSIIMHDRKISITELEVDEMNRNAKVVNGGRLSLVIDDDSQKLKLLNDGPRREIPDWMGRRIGSVRVKLPPKKINVSDPDASNLNLWNCLNRMKHGQRDMLIDHVIDKEVVEKKRKALERTLQRKTVQWHETAEEIKLEPGTGTGREIVFQGFNWESCRKSGTWI